MPIPNTTPTPNSLFDEEMAKMTDTELRIVLIVIRATLGWILDPETGMRKKEDWISYEQLKKKTGRSHDALVRALDNCIKKGWVEVRDKNGNLLDTRQKRERKKLFFRLGKVFLGLETQPSSVHKIGTDEGGEEEAQSSSVHKIGTDLFIKYEHTKENKKNIYSTISTARSNDFADENNGIGRKVNQLIAFLFKEINPNYELLFKNKTERGAMERLLKKYGEDKLKKLQQPLKFCLGQPYAPLIVKPTQLEKKIAELLAFFLREKQGRDSSLIADLSNEI